MANLLDPLPLSGAGEKGVVVSGTVWDALVTRVNLLCSPSLNPPQNVGSFYMSKSGFTLDLSLCDQRLSNNEARLDNASGSGICNGSNIELTINI